MRVEMELRSLPASRIMDYLVQAGGTLDDDSSASGPGWTAVLRPLEPVQISVMVIPRDCLVIEGAPEPVEHVHAFMRRKTLRGGG